MDIHVDHSKWLKPWIILSCKNKPLLFTDQGFSDISGYYLSYHFLLEYSSLKLISQLIDLLIVTDNEGVSVTVAMQMFRMNYLAVLMPGAIYSFHAFVSVV